MDEYNDIRENQEIRKEARRLRRKFLTYKEAELIYSMQHKKLMELADRAGALYRIKGTVLINSDIFDVFLEKKKEFGKLTFSKRKLDEFFPKTVTNDQREEVILELLERWKEDQHAKGNF